MVAQEHMERTECQNWVDFSHSAPVIFMIHHHVDSIIILDVTECHCDVPCRTVPYIPGRTVKEASGFKLLAS